MSIFILTKDVENFVQSYQIDKRTVYPIYEPSSKLKEILDKHNAEMNQERILKIGIVGRVKAGKSSLLNMLFFDGRDVLPKAATPMTAALTRLCYGENYKAEIDCFSESDIAEIKRNASDFEKALEEKAKLEEQILLENNKIARRPINEEDIPRKAKLKALSALKGKDDDPNPDYSAYLQASSFAKSERPKEREIKATSQDDLMGRLSDYVGAGKKYTAYTKSVTLYLPEEGLKGIEVVDTPGVNDPVRSREEVTNKFLDECHVVLSVMPAQNYLQKTEFNFIKKTLKAGNVSECYLVGSRFDDALIDAAVSDDIINPLSFIDETAKSLTQDAREAFSNMEQIKFDDSVFSSSIAFNLLKKIDDKEKFEPIEITVWENLSFHFPEVFKNQEQIKVLLEKLAGDAQLHNIIDDIAKDKEQKIAISDRNFKNPFRNRLHEYLENVEKYTIGEIRTLETADEHSIAKLQLEKEALEKMAKEIVSKANSSFKNSVNQFSQSLQDKLARKNKDIFRIFDAEKGKATDFETYTYTDTVKREESGIRGGIKRLWGRLTNDSSCGYYDYEVERTGTREIKVLVTTETCTDIKAIRKNVEEKLALLANEFRMEWQEEVVESIRSTVNELNTSKEAKENLPSEEAIKNAIANAIANLPVINFALDFLPEIFNKHITLKEKEGDEFIRQAIEYVSNLEESTNKKISFYVQDYQKVLDKQNVGNQLTDVLKYKLEDNLNKLKDKETSINTYKEMLAKTKQLQQKLQDAL